LTHRPETPTVSSKKTTHPAAHTRHNQDHRVSIQAALEDADIAKESKKRKAGVEDASHSATQASTPHTTPEIQPPTDPHG